MQTGSPTASESAPLSTPLPLDPLDLVRDLFTAFDENGVDYCHWKSNKVLPAALEGDGDLDVLVRPEHFNRYAAIALSLGFKIAQSVSSASQPGVYHFLGYDRRSGLLVNLHSYTQLLTGDHFNKTYALPLIDMLLDSDERIAGVRVPTRAAELVIFAVRDLIKHTTIVDVLLRRRLNQDVVDELAWLDVKQHGAAAEALLEQYLPSIPVEEFRRSFELIAQPDAWRPRIALGWRWRSRLARFRRCSELVRIVGSSYIVGRMLANRIFGRTKHMRMLGGGLIVALVGPPATGKSTVAENLRSWLGVEIEVRRIHVGKPPSSPLTWAFNKIMPAMRRLVPRLRSGNVEARAGASRAEKESFNYPWMFVIRRVMVAYDRRRLLRRAWRWKVGGAIVLCDRYPSDRIGAVDGASFEEAVVNAQRSSVKRALMRLEGRLYDEVAPPDLVLQLRVPLNEAVTRNEQRVRQDPKGNAYVEWRHAPEHLPSFQRGKVVPLSTDSSLDETLASARDTVWGHIV